MKTIGLVIPTCWEAGAVLKHFQMRSAGKGLFSATRHEYSLSVRISGVGREKARAAADRLCREQHVNMLVSAGFCGALIPTLKVGDIIRDRIVTVDVPAKTPAERAALAQQTNAVAVDMETQSVIESGTRFGVPIYVLRVISDEFRDDLTPLFGREGSFSFMGIAVRLLNPQVWPLALKLKKQSAIARARLADVVDPFCQSTSL